jgi:tetratricopeptide (TPR) repeat protein/transcriptional regulator with XRE-family HTH domain
MASSACDPLRIPEGFWRRDDVGNALDHRDIGALFRLLTRNTGASQTRIGTATGMPQGTVCLILNGKRVVSAIDVLERIADGLVLPDAARLRLGLAPRGGLLYVNGSETENTTKRRSAISLGLLTAISPETLTSVLRDSAGEAMEFTRGTAVSSVGAGTLDHLEAVVTNLDRSYWAKPPGELFAVARAYRQRVEQLIQGRHTLKEERELYVYAAWLSELLALLAHDFGFPLTAEAYAIDCYEHADQAGHDVLCAWATETMATIGLYAARPGKAVLAAQKGIGRISNQHPLSVRLRTQAACARARQGQRAECVELLTEAQELHDRLPARSPGRLPVDNDIFASHAIISRTASCYIWITDYKQAEKHARTALAVQQSTAPMDRSPKREAIAHIDLSIALAHLGSLDEATAHGSQALSSARVVDSVLSRAGELDKALMTCFPQEAIAQSFHEQYLQTTRQANEKRI